MKITLSKDGEMRADLKVTFRICLEDVVNAIVLRTTDGWDFEDADNKSLKVKTALKYYSSRAKIIKDATDALREHGISLWARIENCASDETIAEIKEQARILVFKKFPAFKKLGQ